MDKLRAVWFFQICRREPIFKKNRRIFLYACGGALTEYSRSYGNSSCGGSEIRVLDYREAIVWAQEKLSCDEYDCTKRVQITVSAKAYEICKKVALSEETTVSQVIEHLILERTGN